MFGIFWNRKVEDVKKKHGEQKTPAIFRSVKKTNHLPQNFFSCCDLRVKGRPCYAKVLQSAERFDPMTGSWEELGDGMRQS